jgi:dTDP-4-dehydrorhamnose 3,5-epimerase-like enzyme
MTIQEQIRLIPRQFRGDARGWLLKVIDGRERDLPPHTGEVYITMALPGQVRGNHFHHQCSEWFTVLQGEADVVLSVPGTGERLEMQLSAETPMTLFVPAGVAHAFRNPANSGNAMLLIAYASALYHISDTVPHVLLTATA